MKTLEVQIKEIKVTIQAQKTKELMVFLSAMVLEAKRTKLLIGNENDYTIFATIKEKNFPDKVISFVI